MLCSIAFIIASCSFTTFFSLFLLCLYISTIPCFVLLSKAELQETVISFLRLLLKFVFDEESCFMFLNWPGIPLDLVNSSSYWKPLYPFVFSVIIVMLGLLGFLLLLCTEYHQAKTVIFVVEGCWHRAAIHLFLDLVHLSNGLAAATPNLTGCMAEQSNICV